MIDVLQVLIDLFEGYLSVDSILLMTGLDMFRNVASVALTLTHLLLLNELKVIIKSTISDFRII